MDKPQEIAVIQKEEPVITLSKEEILKQGRMALLRTFLNFGVTIVDLIPGIGEAVSLSADFVKLLPFAARRYVDLTPDVSFAVALGTELTEIPFLGAFPSHGIEFLLQLRHDVPRMKDALIAFNKN